MPDAKANQSNKKPTLATSGSALGPGASALSSSSSSSSASRNNAAIGKDAAGTATGAAAEEFQGLTLRVVPFDGDSSSDPLVSTEHEPVRSSALPSLVKPLLRVSAKSVSVAKVQRFIHKRMSAIAPPDFPPEAIEILRNGVVQPATSSISQIPLVRDGGSDTKTLQSASDGVIVLGYRRLFL